MTIKWAVDKTRQEKVYRLTDTSTVQMSATLCSIQDNDTDIDKQMCNALIQKFKDKTYSYLGINLHNLYEIMHKVQSASCRDIDKELQTDLINLLAPILNNVDKKPQYVLNYSKTLEDEINKYENI